MSLHAHLFIQWVVIGDDLQFVRIATFCHLSRFDTLYITIPINVYVICRYSRCHAAGFKVSNEHDLALVATPIGLLHVYRSCHI